MREKERERERGGGGMRIKSVETSSQAGIETVRLVADTDRGI